MPRLGAPSRSSTTFVNNAVPNVTTGVRRSGSATETRQQPTSERAEGYPSPVPVSSTHQRTTTTSLIPPSRGRPINIGDELLITGGTGAESTRRWLRTRLLPDVLGPATARPRLTYEIGPGHLDYTRHRWWRTGRPTTPVSTVRAKHFPSGFESLIGSYNTTTAHARADRTG